MSPRVCVLGETMDKAIKLLDILSGENCDHMFRRRRDVGIMHDGTELIAMGLDDFDKMQGWHFDYVFYGDNLLVPYCKNHGSAMEYLEQRCLVRSVVPREFQWCAVNIDI